VFGERVEQYLAAFIMSLGTPEMVAGYLEHDRLKPGLVCPSKLRAAPALGAAIAAVQAWSDREP